MRSLQSLPYTLILLTSQGLREYSVIWKLSGVLLLTQIIMPPFQKCQVREVYLSRHELILSANINMFPYVWIKEIMALRLALSGYGAGYLMLALFISNLHFKSRYLDRGESSKMEFW